MLLKFFTILVFIAELIVAFTLIKKLLEFDKLILNANEIIVEAKSKIKEIGYLIKKISFQYVEFSYDFVAKVEEQRDKSIINQLNKIIIAILLLRMNSKFMRKIIRSKQFKLLSKGLSLLQYVV